MAPAAGLLTCGSRNVMIISARIRNELKCVSSDLIRQSQLVFRGKSRRAGRGSYKEPGPRPALRREGDYDDARAEDYPSEGRVAGIGQATRQCQPSLQDDGVQPGQLLPVQRTVRQRWRVGVAGDQPQKADPEEPHADR